MRVGDVVGSYRVVAELGRGSAGVVYAAEQAQSGRKAALKVANAELCGNQSVVSRYFSEARAAATIGHAGIVKVFDFGFTDGGSAFVARELCTGESLGARLAGGALGVDAALHVLRQVCGVLAAAHKLGLAHRDLKPGNVILEPEPDVPGGSRARVTDFGMAVLREYGSDKSGLGLTATYLAPEQCLGGGQVDQRADLYALGCMLFEAVCGRPPFTGDDRALRAAHLRQPPPAPSASGVALPGGLEALIATLLAKAPAQRLASAMEVLQALNQIAAGPGAPAVPRAAEPDPTPPAPEVPAATPGPAPQPPLAARPGPAREPPVAAGRALATEPPPAPPRPAPPPTVPPAAAPARSPAAARPPTALATGAAAEPARGRGGPVVLLLSAVVAVAAAYFIATSADIDRSAAAAVRAEVAASEPAEPPPAAVADAAAAQPTVVAAAAADAAASAGAPEELAAVSPEPAAVAAAMPTPAEEPPAADAGPAAEPAPVPAPEAADVPLRANGQPDRPSELVTLSVESEPPGAQVVRANDGVRLGQTPYVYETEPTPGRVRFRLELDGHRPQIVTFPSDRDGVRKVVLLPAAP